MDEGVGETGDDAFLLYSVDIKSKPFDIVPPPGLAARLTEGGIGPQIPPRAVDLL